MALTRQERKKRITSKRRKQILYAAREVFSKKGLAGSTVAEIAQTAGVAAGTIYNYFHNKRELLISVISSYILAEPLLDFGKHPTGNLADSLLPFMEDRLNVLFKNAEIQMLLGAEIRYDSELREQYVQEVVQPGLRPVKEYLESGINKGILRQLNPTLAARFLVSVMIGLTILYEIEGKTGFLREIPVHDLASEITALLMTGIKRG
jgi:AcrR family transcriptional regulator